jgi:hypothetical protein
MGTVVCSNKSIDIKNGSNLYNNLNGIKKLGFNN